MKRYRVTLPDGQRVSIRAGYDARRRGQEFVAPATSRLAPFASIDRGYNYHGSLGEEFHVTTGTPADVSEVVLWAADTCSQWDDNVPRLWPVAWCGCEFSIAFSGSRLENEAIISEILLYAFARHRTAYWAEEPYDPQRHIVKGSKLLTVSEIADVLDLAAAGAPYRDALAEKASRRQAERGIHVSLVSEPYQPAPSLMGIVCEADAVHVVFHEEMEKAVRAGGCRMGAVETELRAIIERCEREDRKVFGFTRDLLRVARGVGLEDELRPYFRDGHKIGRSWIQRRRRAGLDDDGYPDDGFIHDLEDDTTPSWTLDSIIDQGGGTSWITSDARVADRLSKLRYEIRGETRRKTLTDKAKRRWQRMLDGNRADCEVLREITIQATTELVELRKASA